MCLIRWGTRPICRFPGVTLLCNPLPNDPQQVDRNFPWKFVKRFSISLLVPHKRKNASQHSSKQRQTVRGSGSHLELYRYIVSNGGSYKPRQQWNQVKTENQTQKECFRQADHDCLAKPGTRMVVQFKNYRFSLQQAPKNSGAATFSSSTNRATGTASKLHTGNFTGHCNDQTLLFNHKR